MGHARPAVGTKAAAPVRGGPLRPVEGLTGWLYSAYQLQPPALAPAVSCLDGN